MLELDFVGAASAVTMNGNELVFQVCERRRDWTTRKAIRTPEYSEELAEFIGIFLGDGGFRNSWQVTVSFNHRADRAYAEFIRGLVRRLFDLDAARYIRPRWSSADLVISSTTLVEFLESIGLPRGRKSEVIHAVPSWVSSVDAYRLACLRGLMDTDGCVYQHRYAVHGKTYTYPKLCFAGSIPSLCQFVEESFRQLGLRPYTHPNGQRIYVTSVDAVHRYFDVVGTHNPRYQERFRQYSGRGARVADPDGLLNRCTWETAYRGFESLPLRH